MCIYIKRIVVNDLPLKSFNFQPTTPPIRNNLTYLYDIFFSSDPLLLSEGYRNGFDFYLKKDQGRGP